MADDNYADKVAKALIDQLKSGTAPWTKPWQPGLPGSLPYNAASGNAYRGINSLYLHVVSLNEGYEDNRWVTYKQAQELGGQVRKGERSTPIQFWQWTAQKPVLDAAGNPVKNEKGETLLHTVKLDKPLVRGAAVFNAAQIDGLAPPPPRPVPSPEERHGRAQSILDNSGAAIIHVNGDRAYYQPKDDRIVLPFQGQFIGKGGGVDLDGYFATALHELGHWTGHPSRLNRDLAHPYGSEQYAREELRAEIASLMLGDELGIGHDPGQHASYVGSWIQVLENDPREIFRAATAAQRITSFVLDLEKERLVERQAELGEGFRPAEGVAFTTNIQEGEASMAPGKRVYLSVPYAERVEARELGARWDKEAKAWWIGANVDPAPFAKWHDGMSAVVGTKGVDPVQGFTEALAAAGLKLPGAPIMDGTLQRVAVEGDKGHQRSGAYIGYLDGRPAGVIQNFKAGTKTTWKADLDAPIDKAAAARLAVEASEKREAREKEMQAEQAKAAESASNLLKAAKAATTHEYLTNKEVAPYGLRLDAEYRLMIPIADFDGKIMSLQTIAADGSKSFLKGGKLAGGQHTIGDNDPTKPLVIAEGYATGASLHELTGMTVSVAFNASNLMAVALAAREKWPDREIIVAGDNDVELTTRTYPDGRPMPNIGAEKATEAARAVDGLAVIAPYDINEPRSLDWNDVVREQGFDQARQQWCSIHLEAQYDRGDFREAAEEHRRAGLDVYSEQMRDEVRSLEGWRTKALHELRENVLSTSHDETHWQSKIAEREGEIRLLEGLIKNSKEVIADLQEGKVHLHFAGTTSKEDLDLTLASESETIDHNEVMVSEKQEEIAAIREALQERSRQADVEAEM